MSEITAQFAEAGLSEDDLKDRDKDSSGSRPAGRRALPSSVTLRAVGDFDLVDPDQVVLTTRTPSVARSPPTRPSQP